MMADLIAAGWLCVLAGAVLGKVITARRWSNNAGDPQRLCSGNRLYKVLDVTPWDEGTSVVVAGHVGEIPA